MEQKPKVLIIGSKGNIGRRYVSIMQTYNIDGYEYDIINIKESVHDLIDKSTHVLIATPPESHVHYINLALSKGKYVLCEKPISYNLDDIKYLHNHPNKDKLNMVCNWIFLPQYDIILQPNSYTIEYNWFYYGKNAWDLIQPLYLSHTFTYHSYPLFSVKVDNEMFTQQDFNYSYLKMIKAWLGKRELLWGIDDIEKSHIKMHDRVSLKTFLKKYV